MAWFDEFNLPGATIDGYFGFIKADGPDDDDSPDVILANGTITFTATTEAARVDGAWLGIQPVTAQIFDGKIVVAEEDLRPVRLLATDADIGVEDWAWRATFDVPGVKFEPLTFKAPQGTTVNLTADLIPIKSAPYQIVKGDSIVDAEADATGRLRFEISNGSFTNWVAVPVGPHTHPISGVTGLQAALDARARITRGILGGGTDFDSMHTLEWAGVWALSASATYLNAPAPGLQGTVEVVFGRGRYGVTQRISSEGRLFWRELIDSTLTVGSWSAWAEGASVAQITPISSSTGWRKLTPLAGSTGDVWMKRSGPWVEFASRVLAPGAAGVAELASIPGGFRPDHASAAVRLGALFTDAGSALMCSYFSGNIRGVNAATSSTYGGRLTWSTSDPWPTNLPGTPA